MAEKSFLSNWYDIAVGVAECKTPQELETWNKKFNDVNLEADSMSDLPKEPSKHLREVVGEMIQMKRKEFQGVTGVNIDMKQCILYHLKLMLCGALLLTTIKLFTDRICK